MNDFLKKINECRVIYKLYKETKVSPELQRTTVAGLKKGDYYNIGVSIKSPKDMMHRKKARIVAGRRALFLPNYVFKVTRKTDKGQSRELHRFMRKIKTKFDLLAVNNDYINIPLKEH